MKHVIMTLWLAMATTLAVAEAEQATSAASAQDQGLAITAEQKEQMKKLVEEGMPRRDARKEVLTKEQLAKVSSHRSQGKARTDSVLGKLGLSDEQREEIKQIRADGGSRKDVRGVLTAEQAAQYDELRQARKANKDKSHKADKKKKESAYKVRGEE